MSSHAAPPRFQTRILSAPPRRTISTMQKVLTVVRACVCVAEGVDERGEELVGLDHLLVHLLDHSLTLVPQPAHVTPVLRLRHVLARLRPHAA